MHRILLLICAVCVAAPSLATAQESWPRFRGPEGNPAVDGAGLPDRWSATENVEWSVQVPGMGWSSPVVTGDTVFVTAARSDQPMKPPQIGTTYSNDYFAQLLAEGKSQEEAGRLVTERDNELPGEISVQYVLYAYELQTGAPRWERVLHEGPPPGGRHRKNSFMSETPVTDGRHLYVYVGNLGLWAFDLEGSELWHTELQAYPIYLDFGTASSPALHEGRLYVVNDNQQEQFVAAFDAGTGEELWRTRRDVGPEPRRSGWATPFVWANEVRTELVTIGPYTAISYDLEGNELWRMDGQSILPAPTPFTYDGLLYLVSGVHGDDNRPITAVRPGASGDITLPENARSSEYVVWHDRVAGTYIPTPVAYQDSIWVLYDRGIFARHDASSGERIYRARIPEGAGAFTSSPWAYDGKIFCINEEGDTFVISAGDEFELLHVNSLGEMALASPAIVGDRLLIRTQSRLWSIREGAAGDDPVQ